MRDYVGLGIQKYGFDAASEGAEALSSRTGVQGYTIRRAGLLEAIFPLRAVALSGGSVPGQTRFGLSDDAGWWLAPRVSRRLWNFRRAIRVEPDSAPPGTVFGEHMQELRPVM